MNTDNPVFLQNLIKESDFTRVSSCFNKYKKQIHERLLESLREEPPTPYLRFVLETPEGYQRSALYIGAFGKALEGDLDFFIKDQEQAGRIRAVEGHRIMDILVLIITLKKIMHQVILNYNEECQEPDYLLNTDDIFIINFIIDCSYILLSNSFIEARDQIINWRRNQLRQLQVFSSNVVSVFKKENILDYLGRAIFDIFGLYGYFIEWNEKGLELASWKEKESLRLKPAVRDLIIDTITSVSKTCQAMAVDGRDHIIQFRSDLEQDFLKFICCPIMDRNYNMLGLVCIHNQGDVFLAERYDKNLVFQLSSFTSAVLSNSKMLQEIADNREELRALTGRLIRFQEEERKRIAEDIHDTLTQSLTGIGYEALLCRKLVKNDTHRLRKELDKLIKQIDTTLTQSREITGCLRPKILDDIGIKAALKSLLRSFQKEQALKIEFSCPNKILIPPNIGISLFRILQEALQNIKKHSRANRVSVSLSLDSYGWLLFLIEDDGCGFDSKQGEKTSWDSGLGILLMEERAGELGGEMKIDSIPGKGCRLKIRIPLGDTKAEWKKLKY